MNELQAINLVNHDVFIRFELIFNLGLIINFVLSILVTFIGDDIYIWKTSLMIHKFMSWLEIKVNDFCEIVLHLYIWFIPRRCSLEQKL